MIAFICISQESFSSLFFWPPDHIVGTFPRPTVELHTSIATRPRWSYGHNEANRALPWGSCTDARKKILSHPTWVKLLFKDAGGHFSHHPMEGGIYSGSLRKPPRKR